ncbi:hypothetical protein JCM10049v2_004844 [Rhodotorula toruloides]
MSTRDEEQEPLLGSDARPADSDIAQDPSFGARLRTALEHPLRLTGLEKALAILSVVLLLLTATGFGLFAGTAVRFKRWKRDHRHAGPPGRDWPHPTSTVTATATTTVGAPTGTPAPPVPPAPPKNPGKDVPLCLTASCVQSAANLLSGLDTSVDPCDNFFEFANGGWIASHSIPPGKAAIGTFQIIDENNKRIIRDIIERDPNDDKGFDQEADKRNLASLRRFWTSCMDEAAIEKKGSTPLLEVLDTAISFWRGEKPLTASHESLVVERDGREDDLDFLLEINGRSDEVSTESHKNRKGAKKGRKWDPKTKKSRLTNALAFLHSRAIPALFETSSDGDVGRDPKEVVLWLTQSGLGLPSKDYYKDKETLKKYEETVAEVLKEVYTARDEPDMHNLAKDVVALEKEIAKISLDVDQLDEPIPTYNPFNASALQSLFPAISFRDYFAASFPRPKYPDPVIVTSPAFFGNLSDIIDKAAPDQVEAYFVFLTSQALAPLLGSKQPIRKSIDLLRNSLTGISPDSHPPRADTCLALLNENYGFLVGRYFVQKAFPGRSKEYAEEVIKAIIQAFRDRLPGRTWLDKETSKKAEEKVDAIQYKIGYPRSPDTEDPLSLAHYYGPNMPISSSDFFGNVLRSYVADEQRKWVKVGRAKNREEWEMVPAEVNAYFSPPDNQIVFPAGILQKPFFDVSWPEYLVFGSFGAIAGHELTHSLDQAGRQYDKDGRLVDWWSNSTNSRFVERQKCFQRQYANYTIVGPDGKHYPINSKFTGGEDGADSGGIAQSFSAWQSRLASDPHGDKYSNWMLPGFEGWSREQLFFVAFAQGWARKSTPAEDVRRIRIDPHSPTKYRVIGPLSNNAAFAKAFGCPVGSPMNRGDNKRCELW